MRIIKKKIGEYAELTGYLHELNDETDNIKEYPAILIFPGGGFRTCSFLESEPIALAYLAEGYQAFTLKYTTVTDKENATIEDPMTDAQKALEWIRDCREEYCIGKEQLALLGFSGGAHLAAATATHGPQRPDVLLLGYPGILHSELRALECPDIIECIDEKTPPTFLFGTRDDKVTPPKHILAFAQALEENNIEFEVHIFRKGEHGFSLAKPLTSVGDKNRVNPDVAQWFQLSVRWLKEMQGEFTVYGVNDGRIGKYSIDTRVCELLESPEAKELVLTYLPMLSEELPVFIKDWITPRILNKNQKSLSQEKLEELDQKLLTL